MRWTFSFALLFSLLNSNVLFAAPVKADPKIERAKLETLWKDLHSHDAIVRTRAVVALIDHPNAVPFLDEKVRPLKVSKEQVVEWLKDLNSEEEKVRGHAIQQLEYYDPRLALTTEEILEPLEKNEAKRLVLTQLTDFPVPERRIQPGASIRIEKITLGAKGAKDNIHFHWQLKKDGVESGHGSGISVERLEQIESDTWTALLLATFALSRIDNPSALAVLERFSIGHPQAPPTKWATALLAPGPPYTPPAFKFPKDWPDFGYCYPVVAAKQVLRLSGDTGAIDTLKELLPAIKADEKQLRNWIENLESEDAKIWRPAYDKLHYFNPALALTIGDQIKLVHSDHGRARLFFIHQNYDEKPPYVTYKDSIFFLSPFKMEIRQIMPGGYHSMEAKIPDLQELNTRSWHRARLAIIALERNASDDAVVVLKQLSDGHPDILPTKDAKAALKRLGK